ncbi:MAG: glycosyltransferase family 4 protein [Thermodesulfovibrionales bacterium]
MRVLVNALSATNLSGRHVLLGHLAKLSEWTQGRHEYVVLFHGMNRDICRDACKNVSWRECPEITAQWAGRLWWEQTNLAAIARKLRVDFVLTASGTITPMLEFPQISYAMNPVPFIKGIDQGIFGHRKSMLQRWGYKKAMKKAVMMLFLSDYMRQMYRNNAGITERASEIVYTGLDEDTFRAGEFSTVKDSKKPFQIICVSVMASHKGIDMLIRSVEFVRRIYKIPAELILVGPWSDHSYEQKIRKLIPELKMDNIVEIKGYASRDDLNKYYAQSKVFCLMSRSESFGIPAVEAQAFGTPVVSSNCCAIPEVCGRGGVYPEPDDIEGTAKAIAKLLTDDAAWQELSEAARQNAERYHWDICSRPLLRMFEIVSSGTSGLQGAA